MLGRSKNLIIQVIDFFYFPVFHKLIPIQTFRYAACGGGNALLNLVLFYLSYNYMFKAEIINVAGIHMNRYIAAFAFSLAITFPLGFVMNKFVVFQTSHLKGRVQLFRYALIAALNILFNYLLLHFFAGFCGFWATPSQALTTIILAVVSYFAQNYFTFRSKS
ncbi:MAG: GtrA family protein [Sphingobacteriales bacterium]|nr:MAG: GtrA family protein [Sphingobacteriales bacterium]